MERRDIARTGGGIFSFSLLIVTKEGRRGIKVEGKGGGWNDLWREIRVHGVCGAGKRREAANSGR